MTNPFIIFGPSHIGALVMIVILSITASLIARKNQKAGGIIAKSLAIILMANQLMYIIYCLNQETIEWLRLWPMELCEWITFLAAIALWTRNYFVYMLTYFWAMAGTLQAVFTPDLAHDIPHMFYFVFFISHIGILVAVMLLTFGFGMRPRFRSIWIAWLCLQVYLVCALVVNGLFESNYGYLCRKPYNSSLFDHLGPWPWYIVSLQGVAIVLFMFWYLPFFIWDQVKKRCR